MAYAAFGIITPVLSVVLSVFMLGLAIGAWAGGRFAGRLAKSSGPSAAFFYAGTELMIGLGGAVAVPRLFQLSERCLLSVGRTNSFQYLFLSALVLAISIFPWCAFMGATFPLMMAYVRELERDNRESFSYLYLANVLGAMSGTLWTALVSVEVLGYQETLWVAATSNWVIVVISLSLGWNQCRAVVDATPGVTGLARSTVTLPFQNVPDSLIQSLLFSTGFCAMAMEVVWTRAFTPVLLTQVYSFASIVWVYLGARGQVSSLSRHLSLALGGKKDTGTWGGGHAFDLKMMRVPPGAANRPYYTPSAQWESYNVLNGHGKVRTPEGELGMSPGDCFIQAPGEAHQIRNPAGRICSSMLLPTIRRLA